MKSDIYTEKHGMEIILSKMDAIGALCGLPPSDTGKLRLLTEEMLALTVRLFENLKYEFCAENKDKRFTLRLTAETAVNQSQKEKMLSLSKSGKNKAEQGVFGAISGVFESLLMNSSGVEQIFIPQYDGMEFTPYFALSVYRESILSAVRAEPNELWDGLEKSIIATLAKDVIIGVKSNKVEMIVFAEF